MICPSPSWAPLLMYELRDVRRAAVRPACGNVVRPSEPRKLSSIDFANEEADSESADRKKRDPQDASGVDLIRLQHAGVSGVRCRRLERPASFSTSHLRRHSRFSDNDLRPFVLPF